MQGTFAIFPPLISFFLLLTSADAQTLSDAPMAFGRPGESAEITADKLEYLREADRYIADGNVRVLQGDIDLSADHVLLDNQTGLIEASGNVVLQDGEDLLSSDHIIFNLRSEDGAIRKGQLFIEEDHIYLNADWMERTGDKHYELENWSITACDPCDEEDKTAPLWRFRGLRAKADLGKYLHARHVVFYIKDIPVLYTPYLILPIKTNRQTGLLVPKMGYSTRDGLKINQALFWALGPSQDATLTVDYRSQRGVGAELEYRYKLRGGSHGQLEYALFDDRLTNSRRTETKFQHLHRFSEDFQARMNVHLVSDINQFRDLEEVTADRVQQRVESTFVTFRRWNNQELHLLARLTRDLSAETDTTLQILPKIQYSLREYRLGALPLYVGLDAAAVHFWREEETVELVRAKRLDFFPRLWTRINLGGVTLTPRAGYRETWYSRELIRDSPIQRGVEVFDIGANTRLSRRFESSGPRRILHHIEPAVLYEYIPKVDQTRLPVFDEVDQLPRKNHLTYSLTNRFVIEKETPSGTKDRREGFFWKVTQSYDLHRKRMEKSSDLSRPFSNIRSEASVRPLTRTTLDVDVFYDLYQGRWVSFNSDLDLEVWPNWALNVGQRYTREGLLQPRGDLLNPLNLVEQSFWYTEAAELLRFLTLGTRLSLPWGVTLTGRAYYDVNDRVFAEVNYGLQYVAQCVALELNYQDLQDRNQISFLVTLRPSDFSDKRPGPGF